MASHCLESLKVSPCRVGLPQTGVTQVYVPPPLTGAGKREQYELVESLYRIVRERGLGGWVRLQSKGCK